MRSVLAATGLVALLALAGPAGAEPSEAESRRAVTREVMELCRGGTLEEREQDLYSEGGVGADVIVLRRLLDLGLDGRFTLRRRDREGMPPILADNLDHETYNDCVTRWGRWFLERLDAPEADRRGAVKVRDGAAAALCGGELHVGVEVFRASATQPRPEAVLTGLPGGPQRLRSGETRRAPEGCCVTLDATGRDFDFYALLSYDRECAG